MIGTLMALQAWRYVLSIINSTIRRIQMGETGKKKSNHPMRNSTMFDTDITQKNISALIASLSELISQAEDDDISLFLSSGGGDTMAGFRGYDVIRFIMKNDSIITKGTGIVASMAIILFLSSDTRMATLHTKFFFHELGITPKIETRHSVTEVFSVATSLKADQERYAEIVSLHTLLTKEDVLKLMREETELTAQEALEYGIIHEIIS